MSENVTLLSLVLTIFNFNFFVIVVVAVACFLVHYFKKGASCFFIFEYFGLVLLLKINIFLILFISSGAI